MVRNLCIIIIFQSEKKFFEWKSEKKSRGHIAGQKGLRDSRIRGLKNETNVNKVKARKIMKRH